LLNLHFNRPDALLNATAFQVQATSTGTFTRTTASTTTGPYPVSAEGPACATSATGFFPTVPTCISAPNGMTNAIKFDATAKQDLCQLEAEGKHGSPIHLVVWTRVELQPGEQPRENCGRNRTIFDPFAV